MRTLVDLPKDQIQALTRVCQNEKISRAEAVRRAVNLYLKHSAGNRPAVGFGLWKGRKIDSSKFVAKQRGDWDQT